MDTPQSLREINAQLTASVAENGIKIFPKGPPPKDTVKSREVMESSTADTYNEWDQLSDQFYKEEENLDSLLLSYAEKNIKKE